MKSIGLLGILLFAVAAEAAFSTAPVQTVVNNSAAGCNGSSGASCALTVTATGSGHLMVIAMTLQGNASIAGASGGCANWTHPANAQQFNTSVSTSVDLIYCLSSTAGATAITVSVPSNASRGAIFYEFSSNGAAITLDTVGTPGYNTGFTTTAPAAAIAPTGSNDLIVQALNSGGTYTSIGGGPAVNGGFAGVSTAGARAAAYVANTKTSTGATWIGTNLGAAAVTAIAFTDSAPPNCKPGNVTDCITQLSVSQDLQGTAPLVSAIFDQQYSTLIDSAKERLDIYYVKSHGATNGTDPINVFIHGGGCTGGDKSQETWAATLPANMAMMSEQLGQAGYSLNYTLCGNTAATASPIQFQEITCALHAIAHNAGVVWPGNPKDMRLWAWSWGTLYTMLAAWAPNQWTQNCEYNDPYTIRLVANVAMLGSFPNEFNAGTVGAFQTATKDNFVCTTAATCATNGWMAGSPKSYLSKTGVRMFGMHGSADSVTLPQYQGDDLQAAFAGIGVAMDYVKDSTPGFNDHNADCQLLYGGVCWNKLMQRLGDKAHASAAGGVGPGVGVGP